MAFLSACAHQKNTESFPCYSREIKTPMASSSRMKTIKSDQLFLKVLPRATQKAFLKCIESPLFTTSKWYLAGGTALALQEGHRQSVDLDFFTPLGKFNETGVERELFNTGEWETTLLEKGTIFGIFSKAKMSLIAYPFFIPSDDFVQCGTVKILTSKDIATMKVVAISQRGRKRDFVDMYWYCSKYEKLGAVIERALQHYSGQEHNIPHILKSLTYFEDADADPMPKLFFKATWNEVKKFFEKEVPHVARKFLRL